jgi:hypothetical protein
LNLCVGFLFPSFKGVYDDKANIDAFRCRNVCRRLVPNQFAEFIGKGINGTGEFESLGGARFVSMRNDGDIE